MNFGLIFTQSGHPASSLPNLQLMVWPTLKLMLCHKFWHLAWQNQTSDTRDIQGLVSQVWHFTTVCAHFWRIFVIFSSDSLYFTSWYAHISWWTSTIWASRHSIHQGLSEKCQLEPSKPFRLSFKCSTKNLQHLFWDGGSNYLMLIFFPC